MPMLTEALAMAIAMLITADDDQQTPRDMRLSYRLPDHEERQEV